jgi:uncharacterized oxidoreductase
MRLSDHKVLITGGSAGIGLALARAFTSRGNRVLIAARGADRLHAAARGVPDLQVATCDVRREDQLRQLIERAGAALGGLSILVNNAGIQRNDKYGETDEETVLTHVDDEIGVNLTALVKLSALAIPLLSREPESAIVNVSSVLALAPKQSAPIYCASKAAVRSFTKALRYQLEQRAPAVRVVEVLPPMVDTAMTRGRAGPKMPPHEVADAVLAALEADRTEVLPGRARAFARLFRVLPGRAERLMRGR